MIPENQQIPEWHNVDERTFKEKIVTQSRPAVLRGFVKDWPAVQQALQSSDSILSYIKSFDSGRLVNAIMTPPEERGRVAYNSAMDGFNFVRNKLPISAIVDQLSRYLDGKNPPCLAAQSALIPDCLPGFEKQNYLPFLEAKSAPRIWIGNTITVPAHIDDSRNIACVVSGRRRFTLFPPEQISNLYIGPLEFSPAGSAISLVNPYNPDLNQFPNYPNALAQAQTSELLPGDAIYIPPVWWHQVESLGKLNILVNYWWDGSINNDTQTLSPSDSLLHTLLSMKNMSAETRAAWGAVFHHYIFGATEEQFSYIPENRRGVLGNLTPEQAEKIKKDLIRNLQN
jgi:hypothetical protein